MRTNTSIIYMYIDQRRDCYYLINGTHRASTVTHQRWRENGNGTECGYWFHESGSGHGSGHGSDHVTHHLHASDRDL